MAWNRLAASMMSPRAWHDQHRKWLLVTEQDGWTSSWSGAMQFTLPLGGTTIPCASKYVRRSTLFNGSSPCVETATAPGLVDVAHVDRSGGWWRFGRGHSSSR